MRYLFFVISLLFCQITLADSYDLMPTPIGDAVSINVTEDEDSSPIIVTSLDDIEEVIDGTKENLQNWHDIWMYLFGTTGLGVSGFLTRVGYLYYQTKRGQLIVKHIKNNADDISEDVIESIDRLTEIESGEVLRNRLKYVQDELLRIAKSKLPPKI